MTNAPRNDDLTQAGRERRDAMLGELTTYMGRVHRARKMRRRAGAIALVLALSAVIAVAALSGGRRPASQAVPIARNVGPGTNGAVADDVAPIDVPAVRIAVVRSDASIVEKYRTEVTQYSAMRVQRLSDDDLLRQLDALGRPAGLIRMEGRTWLTADVSDSTPPDLRLNLLPES